MPLFLFKFLPLLLKLTPVAKVLPYLKKVNWKLVAILLCIALVFGNNWLKNNKIESLERERAEYSHWMDDAEEANGSLVATVESLRAANEALAQAVIVSDQVRADAYAAARERERRAAIRLDDTLNTLKDLQNETPTCGEVNRIDIGAACPRSIELLRQAAKGTFDTDGSSDREGTYVSSSP